MPREIVSEREKRLPKLTIGKLLKIAKEDKNIISLGPGEPDFVAPEHIREAAKQALDKGCTHYSPVSGRADLKEKITEKLEKENGISVEPEQVVVTAGSTEAIMLALMCVIDPGDGVIIPDPGFLAYRPCVEILNGMPLILDLKEEEGFQIAKEDLERAILPEKTKAIIINTPGNPTGVVFSRKTLEEIADFAVEYDLLIISDEAYEKFVYDEAKHISIGSLNGMGSRVLTLQSFSKSYAMPGFRLGYAAGPKEVINGMKKLHIFSSVCAPTISQIAGLHALSGNQKCVEEMRKEYDRRRKMIVKRVNEIDGFSCVKPEGAFYVFPNIKDFGLSSYEFAEKLLKEAKVAVVPGTEFGRNGEGFVRLSYATAYEKIEEAANRIERWVKGFNI